MRQEIFKNEKYIDLLHTDWFTGVTSEKLMQF